MLVCILNLTLVCIDKQFLLPEVNAETIQLAGTDVGRMGGVFPKECLEAFFHILL